MASKFQFFRGYHLTAGLFLAIILLLISIFYLSQPVIKNTQIYNDAQKYYQDNTWVTFKSDRAKFSFKHPISWPVTPAPDSELKDEGPGVESIDFDTEWFRNAGGPKLGFIIVRKESRTLDEYVTELQKTQVVDMYVKGRTQKVTIYPPKIEYLTIGGEKAISVTDTNTQFATFSRETADYRVIRNGLLYTFATIDSSRFLENKEKNSQTFQKIVESVKFD